MALPNDPIMLYSAVNMKLRDSYSTLEELCAAEGIEHEILNVPGLNTIRKSISSDENSF